MFECGMCFEYYGLQTEDGTHVNLYAFLFVSMASSCVYELGGRRSAYAIWCRRSNAHTPSIPAALQGSSFNFLSALVSMATANETSHDIASA